MYAFVRFCTGTGCVFIYGSNPGAPKAAYLKAFGMHQRKTEPFPQQWSTLAILEDIDMYN